MNVEWWQIMDGDSPVRGTYPSHQKAKDDLPEMQKNYSNARVVRCWRNELGGVMKTDDP